MRHSKHVQVYPAAILLWALLVAPLCAVRSEGRPRQSQNSSISELRAEYAMRFLEPGPHMALAKYFRDKGNRLQAFYILETARRGRFAEDEFNKAFALTIRGSQPPDYSPAAEVALLSEHAADPNKVEPIVKLGNIYISRKDWTRAKEFVAKAARLKPEDYENTEALATIFRLEGKPDEGDRLIREYAEKYPETLDGYQLRIAGLSEKDPVKAKQLLLEAMKKFPQDGDFVFELAATYQREGKLKEAEEHYVRAAAMSPDSVNIQAWVGRFFYKLKQDDRRALDYYLNAYLFDPHAYESEYVESRIPKISAALAKAHYEQQRQSGVPLTKILEDPDPGVVYKALEEMSEKWDPTYLKPLVELMGHDDGGVRWLATQMIKEKADRSFDGTLKALLNDKDLRKRGLAAYIAVALWQQESFAVMRSMLKEEAQILRFDAVSALIMEGGAEGRAIVIEHLPQEKHPKLKKLIESAIKPPEPQ